MAEDLKSLVSRVEELGETALGEVGGCATLEELEVVRQRYLGKKGELSQIARQIKDVPTEDRAEFGESTNRVKTALGEAIAQKRENFEEKERATVLETESIDVTLPGRPATVGHVHPVTSVLNEIEDIFVGMGFKVVTGPDMEDEFHNFEALNIPRDHPARDMHDTFYLEGGGVLRTHTSPVQIRAMRSSEPPLAIIAPGKVYRCDSDTTHSPMFHQVEGFLIDKDIKFSDLKGVLVTFLHRMLGEDVKYRFRPSYFPFTEPSAEVDILWEAPGRDPEWMEVLGSGMIHPKVLEAGGYNPEQVTGFAFGVGVERFAMLKYGIPNIRLFYENDVRFLRQF